MSYVPAYNQLIAESNAAAADAVTASINVIRNSRDQTITKAVITDDDNLQLTAGEAANGTASAMRSIRVT